MEMNDQIKLNIKALGGVGECIVSVSIYSIFQLEKGNKYVFVDFTRVNNFIT